MVVDIEINENKINKFNFSIILATLHKCSIAMSLVGLVGGHRGYRMFPSLQKVLLDNTSLEQIPQLGQCCHWRPDNSVGGAEFCMGDV